MASRNTAVIKLVGDNDDLRKKLADSERRVKGLERAVGRTKKSTKGAFSPLAESAHNALGPLGGLTRKLHGVASEAKKAGKNAEHSTDQVGGLGGKFKGLGGIAKGAAGPLLGVGAALAGIGLAARFLDEGINKLKKLSVETRKLSNETGMNNENASAWIGVAKRMGVPTAKLSASFGILSKSIHKVTAGDKGSEKMAGDFEDLGVSFATLQSGNMDQILLAIAGGWKNIPKAVDRTALAMRLFGRGGKDLIPILNLGKDGVTKLKQEMKDLGLTIDEKTTGKVKDLSKAQKTLNDIWDGAQIQLATNFIPAISDTATELKNLAVQMRTGKAPAGSLGETVNGVTGFLGGANKAINKLKDNPIGDIFQKAINPLSALGGKLDYVFGSGLDKDKDKVVKFASGIWNAIKSITKLPKWVGDRFDELINAIGSRVSKVFARSKRIGVAIWNGITGAAKGIASWVGKQVGRAVSAVGGRVSGVFNAAKRFGTAIKNGITGGLGSVWNAIKGTLQRGINGFIHAVNWVSGKANKAIGWFNKLPGPDVGKIGMLPDVKLAQGAIVRRPTMALIGEAGPEAVIPLSLSRRARGQELYAQAGAALGMNQSSSSMTFNVVNNGNQMDEQMLASKIAWQLQTRGL